MCYDQHATLLLRGGTTRRDLEEALAHAHEGDAEKREDEVQDDDRARDRWNVEPSPAPEGVAEEVDLRHPGERADDRREEDVDDVARSDEAPRQVVEAEGGVRDQLRPRREQQEDGDGRPIDLGYAAVEAQEERAVHRDREDDEVGEDEEQRPLPAGRRERRHQTLPPLGWRIRRTVSPARGPA